jgi:hypothetical protein
MAAAADDLDRGGIVSELFDGLPSPRGSVPQLRLMAALHELVLSDQAPALARYYPSTGGDLPPGRAWPCAQQALQAHRDWIRERLPRTVQTNEVGRSTVLYAVLLWLAHRHGGPIRLLEIGASAGLNLRADRYAYLSGELTLGDPSSALRFRQPWRPPPAIDLTAAQGRLTIADRAGCDLSPLDPRREQDRRRLLSYIWPDEPERLSRLQDALAIAATDELTVARSPASAWLPEQLQQRQTGELTVVWHSIVQQYVPASEWEATLQALRQAHARHPDREIVRVAMEPRREHIVNFTVTRYDDLGGPGQVLAECGDHGPPVSWTAPATPA